MTITAPLTHTGQDGTQIVLAPHQIHGYLVQTRGTDGLIVSAECSRHNLESDALRAYAALIEQHPATPAQPTVKLTPPAKGTATKVSDAQHSLLAVASINGYLHRGGGVGQATDPQLRALAKRGLLRLDIQTVGRRKVLAGGWITGAGSNALDRLTEADREHARIAAAVAGDVKTNQPVAA